MVTVLHISDTQFGAHHAFGDDHESLGARLITDLRELRGSQSVNPDLIVLSGDITENGKKLEFKQAVEFCTELLEACELSPDRMLWVPGNHDVSWGACERWVDQVVDEGQFPTVEAAMDDTHVLNGTKARVPAKWRYFIEATTELGIAVLSEDQPYWLVTFDGMGPTGVAVALMNSTMHDSHRDEDHYGWGGEPQYQWIAKKLDELPSETLRVGVIHHQLHKPEWLIGDAEQRQLDDARSLSRCLNDKLDVLLHGHTHEGGFGTVEDTEIVRLGVGSAAVNDGHRRDGVTNHYQVLRFDVPETGSGDIGESVVTRISRKWSVADKAWQPDGALRGGGGGRPGEQTHRLSRWHQGIRKSGNDDRQGGDVDRFADLRDDQRSERRQTHQPARPCEGDWPNDPKQIDLIEEVLKRLWQRRDVPPDEVRLHQVQEGLWYLSISHAREGLRALGILDGPATDDALEAFVSDVRMPLRRDGLTFELVHTGRRDPAMCRSAENRGVRLVTLVEIRDVLDLSHYRSQLLTALRADEEYEPSTYIDQRFWPLNVKGARRAERSGLADEVAQLLVGDVPLFLLVLGEAGHGKTFLMHMVALDLLEETKRGGAGVTPILVKLRGQDKTKTIRELVSTAISEHNTSYRPALFQDQFTSGHVVVLLDGYDEYEIRVGFELAATQLRQLLHDFKDASGEGRREAPKVVLTSRPGHFYSNERVTSMLYEAVAQASGGRVVSVAEFNEAERGRFLRRTCEVMATKRLDGFGTAEADIQAEAERLATAWEERISVVPGLADVASTPRMLSFILDDLELADFSSVDGSAVTVSDVYEQLLDRWITTKRRPTDARPGGQAADDAHSIVADRYVDDDHFEYGVAQTKQLLGEIALEVWLNREQGVREELAGRILNAYPAPEGVTTPVKSRVQEILVQTGICRAAPSDHAPMPFLHQSIADYLTARRISELFESAPALAEEHLQSATPNDLMLTFLDEMAPNALDRWMSQVDEERGLTGEMDDG